MDNANDFVHKVFGANGINEAGGAGSGAVACVGDLNATALSSVDGVTAEEVGLPLPLESAPECWGLAEATMRVVLEDPGAS